MRLWRKLSEVQLLMYTAQHEPKPCAQLPRMTPPRASHSEPLRHTPCTHKR